MATGHANITVPSATIKAYGMQAAISVEQPLPDDHPFYALIGRAIAEWARLEHNLDLIIWDLIGSKNELSSCLTAEMMNFRPRFNAIVTLLAYHKIDKQFIDNANKLLKTMYEITDDRNRYTHDAWFLRSTSVGVDKVEEVGQFRTFAVKRRRTGFYPVDNTEILEFIEKIKVRTEQIITLRRDISNFRKASP